MNLRVFVVDDDLDFAESLADVLESRGCLVDMAFSGEEAVDKFAYNDYDVTLMDMKMPGMNGLESFLEFRKAKPSARVILMTAYTVETLVSQALDNGAMAVLDKPLDLDRVLCLLNNLQGKGNILLVDQDPGFALNLAGRLTLAGFTVRIAQTLREGIAFLQDETIDFLVLDIRLTDLDCPASTDGGSPKLSKPPAIILTTHTPEEQSRVDCLRCVSIRDVLVKPFPAETLIGVIEKIPR